MEQNTIMLQVKRRNKAEIKLLLEAFAKAGQSVQSFCDQHNIGKSTFHKWQSRYSINKAFTDIEIVNGDIQHGTTLFAEVRGVKIYQPVSAAYLKELLA